MRISEKYKLRYDKAYEELNRAQKDAVDTIEGPVLVIAGPGTGKTQILSVRIGRILLETDTNPENILCLTYTDAGTIAMRKRLSDFIGPDAYRVNIYTFHAFCNDVIQANADLFGKRELEPVSELEAVNMMEDLLNSLPASHPLRKFRGDLSYEVSRMQHLFRIMKEEDWHPELLHRAIDKYIDDLSFRDEYIYKKANAQKNIKAGDLKQKDIDEETERMEKLRCAVDLFPVYQQKMLEAGRYDYSDMILWVVKAFKENESLLRNYQERYLYFLVDEFQDTNGAQNEILSALINYWETPNVFAVGDDDQSIYEFQGARLQNIMDFYAGYKNNIKVVVLTENYRSNQPILDCAKNLIDNNSERLISRINGLDKKITAALEERIKNPVTPIVHEYENSLQEEAGILMQVEELQKNGFPLHEIAVIYHRHVQAENLIRVFEKKGIPYQVRKRINILDLPIIRQVISIFRYLHEESKKAHAGEYELFRMMHYHFFGMHPHDIASLAAYYSSKKDPQVTWREIISNPAHLDQIRLKNPEAIIKFEQNLKAWITESQNFSLQMLFEKILHEGGLLNYILTSSERVWLMEVISTFFDFIKSEGTRLPRLSVGNLLRTLEQMDIHGIGLPVNKTVVNGNGVNFITAHSAKGLEFETVFLLGCTADKWEKARGATNRFKLPDTITFSQENANAEALRRLFYVALTRAKQNLVVSYASHGNEGKELETSRFVSEMLSDSDIHAEQQTISADALIHYRIAEVLPAPQVEVDLFDKEFISSRLGHFIMSASVLNAYLSCPVKYYFEHIIKIPQAKNDSMAFGTAAHFALRRLFERMKEAGGKEFPTLEIFIGDFLAAMKTGADSFTEKQYQNRVDLGKQVLQEYYQKYIPAFNKIVVTEYPMRNIQFENIPLTGVFDKIEFTGNDVNVVDYKTGNLKYAKDKLLPPDDANPNGGDYWRQIVFYRIMMDLQRIKPWKMVSGEIDFIEKGDGKDFYRHKFIVSAADIETVKNQIVTVHGKIMQMEFTRGCNKPDCIWCKFVREHYPQPERAEQNMDAAHLN